MAASASGPAVPTALRVGHPNTRRRRVLHIGKDQIGVISDIPLLAADVVGRCGAVAGQLDCENEGSAPAARSLLRKS
jgi:hypothetical protein